MQTQVADIFKRLDKVDSVLEALKGVLEGLKPGAQQPATPASPEVNVNAPKFQEVRKRGGRTVRRVEKEKTPAQGSEKKEPWYLRRLF